MKKIRIWELDALRGFCILTMLGFHFLFDVTHLYGIAAWEFPGWLLFVMDWGGVVFFLISGVCATLGSRCVRRGLTVLGCGLIVSAVTVAMYLLGMAYDAIIIRFGVLHCLGVCMILWALFRRLPTAALAVLSVIFIALGLWFRGITVESRWLFWLGLLYKGFATSDYFPLLPFLGFFLAGAVLGRLLYKEKKTLLPGVNPRSPIPRFLQWAGRWSLPIYLLHQPLLTGLIYLILIAQEVS